MGMFIDNTNVTDINDLAEMKAFAKGLAIGFKTEEKNVQMGIIANGMRSNIPTKYGWNPTRNGKTRHRHQLKNTAMHGLKRKNVIKPHFKSHHRISSTVHEIMSSTQAKSKNYAKFHPENAHTSQAVKRAEAYLLAKQKKAIPPILNDVLFVLVSGAESDVEVHAPIKDMKAAGAKIVVIGVGKDAKIGKLGSQADEKFMVMPGAGNAIVNAIVLAVCKKCT